MKVYLDNAATTPLNPKVLNEMLPYLKNKFYNPSSLYSGVGEIKEAIENSRKIIAELINAEPSEIIFTSGGTESNNTIIKGLNVNRIIISAIEHPAVLETAKASGKEVIIIPVDNQGLVDLRILEENIQEKDLVSIMHVNNEIGTIQNLKEISKLCKARGALFHTDAVQSFGKIDFDVKNMGIDFLSASGHKINGPKGIGILYIRKELQSQIKQLMNGGGQEYGLRSGTENVAGIIGIGKAAELSKNNKKINVQKLRDKLLESILKIPGTKLNGSQEHRIFNNINISIRGIEGEALIILLDIQGIQCSTGSACSTKLHKSSDVLKAINLSEQVIHSSIRITLGYNNTSKEIDYTIKKLKESIIKLRNLSGE